jgi:uncharacterized protein YlxP (DUF503 family)
MFVCVARVAMQVPESGSLKSKRQVLRRITDRVKARFNVSVAEVEDNDLWQRATIALAVVGNDKRHVNEQMDKILHSIEEMYVAPVIARELEILSFGDDLFGAHPGELALPVDTGHRSLAEAEGIDWDKRHEGKPAPKAAAEPKVKGLGGRPKRLSLDEARAKARTLRNKREWEK